MLTLSHLLTALLSSCLVVAIVVAAVPPRRTNLCYKNVTQPTRCLYLSHPTFLELELPYKTIALPEHIPGLKITGEEIIRYSQRWLEVKRTLPRCWPDLQVALAAMLMPQCDEDSTTGYATKIYQPSHDICNDLVKRNNCQFLERHYGWLPMFNCSDPNLYNRNCTNNLRELKSHSLVTHNSDSCKYPLVPTNDSKLWFRDVTGCAMNCKYPIMSPQDHSNISSIIALLGMIGFMSTSLAVVLYVINNRTHSRMAEVTRQCTLCQLMVYLGWLMQFVYNHELACSSNGATPSGDSRICVMTFFLTYAPSLASLLWCAYLAKLCFEKLTGVKKEDSKGPGEIDKNIYVFCYGVPLCLFIIASLIDEIESHGLYGICTVGRQSNIVIKLVFLHVPTLIGVSYENFYFIRTVYKLRAVENKNQRLKRNLTRILALAFLSTIHLASSIGRHIYELKNHERLIEDVDKYLACNLNLDKVNEYDYYDYSMTRPECTINTKPMTMIYYIELISTLSMGTVIASWAFCEANFRSLRRKIVDILADDKDIKRRYYQSAGTGIVAEYDETYHDIIDATTPTHKPRGIELNGVADKNSINSTALYISQEKEESTTQPTLPMFKKRKHVESNRTARDVREEIKFQQQRQTLMPDYEDELATRQPMLMDNSFVMQCQWQALLSHIAAQQKAAMAAPTAAQPEDGSLPQLSGTQAFVPTRPPWADRNETPRIDFTHGVSQQIAAPSEVFVPTRPPWADRDKTPQIEFTHGVAQRQK